MSNQQILSEQALCAAKETISTHAILEFRDVTITYGSEVAVSHVDFNIDGCFRLWAIVGESGSGKTTLMRAAYGLLPPDAVVTGTILLNGRDISTISKQEWRNIRGREVSMIFQNPGSYLNPHRTIDNHFKDVFRAHGESYAIDRVRRMLELVELTDTERVLASYPFQLSGGMQQRVAIALSLILEPKLVFADEPTSALDVLVEQSILRLLRRISRELGTTIVLVTHSIKAALEVVDYMAIMHKGVVVDENLNEEIQAGIGDPYTKQLLASMMKVV